MISLDTPNTLKASKVQWPCQCTVYYYTCHVCFYTFLHTFQSCVFQSRPKYIQKQEILASSPKRDHTPSDETTTFAAAEIIST